MGCSCVTSNDLNHNLEGNIIMWIDSKIYNKENWKYLNKLKANYSLNLFVSVDEAINEMKKIKFKETKIIISDELYSEFVQNFKYNILNMYIAPKIIIFASDINYFVENNNIYNNLKNNFYKFGGVTDNIEKIEKFLENEIETDIPLIENKIDNNNLNKNIFTFDYMDSKIKLMLPMFFKVLIDSVLNENMKSYTNTLYNNYSKNNDEIKKLLSSIKSMENIPIEILYSQ